MLKSVEVPHFYYHIAKLKTANFRDLFQFHTTPTNLNFKTAYFSSKGANFAARFARICILHPFCPQQIQVLVPPLVVDNEHKEYLRSICSVFVSQSAAKLLIV